MNAYPKTFSHIGISVPDLDKAVEFYENVMGWYGFEDEQESENDS